MIEKSWTFTKVENNCENVGHLSKRLARNRGYWIIAYVSLISPFVILVISCKNKGVGKPKNAIHSTAFLKVSDTLNLSDSRVYNQLLKQAMGNSDTAAYLKLSGYNFVSDQHHEFFYYSFVFALKNRYPVAFHNMYYELSTESGINGLDSVTRNFALYCLTRSYELGYSNAKFTIDEVEEECKCKLLSSGAYLKKVSF